MKKVFILSLIIVFTLVSFIVPMGSADASTSRVAIISKWEGTVEVQKSGGTKVFKAFNNMSLNQGDIVTTGKDSTAVLKFSNGTSSDDTLTLEADTTVTFTKLTNKSGTTTKVRMQKGNAWVDVKSIQNKDDEFTLETPTAIMGVRGTHFMVAIDPKTNQYVLSVVAGIVTVDNTQNNASTNNNNSAQMVYPGMVLTELANESNVRPMTNADLNNIIKQAPEVLIAQLIQQARDIINENQQYLDAGLLSNLPIDLEALKFSTQDYQTNVSNIMSYLFGAAIQEGIITQERFNELVKELEQLGNKVDVSPKPPQLIDTPEIREQYQNEQKQKEAELAAALKKQQEKLANHNQSEVLKKLAEQKRIELQKKEEEERRRAEAEYLLKLHAAAKLAYENNKKAKEQEGKTTVPSGTNQNSSSPSTPTSPKAPDWNNEQKPFVVYYKTGDQEEELPYESTEEADWHFHGISSIIARNGAVAAIHANGKYQVTGVTANQTTINQVNGLYLIDLIQMDELILDVTVQDVISNSSHTYTVRYRVEQATTPNDPDWNNELTPFVVYYKTGGQEEELPYESTEEADWHFQGISSIVAENDSVAAIHADGKYQVIGVTANQTTINQANGLYLIDLIQMDELILAVTVQDVASKASHTYTVRYRVEQETTPNAPDWNNELTPFVVYYKTGDQEEELPYESTEEADWNFQGISSIIAENDSVAAIHANGKYQVTGVTANQTTINQANGLYLIDLIQMDELVLAVTVQDVTSNSSHTYTLRYRVEQAIPPIIHPDEFQIIAERFINDNIQQKILNTVYQATPSPTYTSSPVLAGEADPSLLKIILKIPNALEVTVRDESTNQSVVVFPEDEGYSIEIPYSNDINVRVMTNEMRLYNIHIPLQRSINLGALFQLFVDDDLVAHQSTQYATEFLYRLSATDQLKTIKVKGADTYQITAFDAYPNVSVTNNASYYTLTLTEPSQTNEVQVYMTLSNGENIRNLYLKIIVEN